MPKELRNFGFLFTAVFLALTAFAVYKGNSAWPWFAGAAGFFLITGIFLFVPGLRQHSKSPGAQPAPSGLSKS